MNSENHPQRPEPPSPASAPHELGVVVIGRNEGERLARCLGSLAGFPAAVVYVDSASSDGSADLARAAGAHVVDLDLSKPFTAARARNEGVARLDEVAPGARFIQFADGDCELAPGWMGAALSFMADRPDVAVVCGRRRERWPERSAFNRLCDLEWNTPVGEAEACGGDSLMRAEAFHAAGGFDERLTAGEEPELCARLRAAGWRIWRIDEEMTLHDADMTRLSQWWMRAVRSGYGYAQVHAATRGMPRPLYARELRRATMWGGALPAAGLAALAVSPWLAALVASLPVAQIMRIAARRGPRSLLSWQYASLMMLGKLPELQGALRYLRSDTRRPESAITYK